MRKRAVLCSLFKKLHEDAQILRAQFYCCLAFYILYTAPYLGFTLYVPRERRCLVLSQNKRPPTSLGWCQTETFWTGARDGNWDVLFTPFEYAWRVAFFAACLTAKLESTRVSSYSRDTNFLKILRVKACMLFNFVRLKRTVWNPKYCTQNYRLMLPSWKNMDP